MADVWLCTVTIEDDKGKKRTHKLYLPQSGFNAFDSAFTFFNAYIEALNGVIAGAVVKANIKRSPGVPLSLRHSPNPVADVEELLAVKMIMDPITFNPPSGSSKRYYSFKVATWRDEFFLPPFVLSGDRHASFDPEVVAWKNLLRIAPTVGHPANPANSRGERFGAVNQAKQYFKKSRS